MAHKFFVVNAGSSSIKYKVIEFNGDSPKELADGKVERIGEEKSILSHKNLTNNKSIKNEESTDIKDHHAAIVKILDLLTSKDNGLGVLETHDDVAAVGHRLVHGGDDPAFLHPTLINDAVLRELHSIKQLAPLHTTANLTGVEAVTKLFSQSVPQYVVCDTSFHATLPEVAYRYAVPEDWYTQLKIRKYGFHGISHLYVAKRLAKHLGRPLKELNLITVHLGNGSSVACIKNGESVDTSMGFTPLAGLVMGSRVGDIDAGVVDYYVTKTGKNTHETVKILNTKSGMKGLCGSNDMREVIKRMNEKDEKAKLAFDSFCYSIRKYVGEYFFVLGGKVDAVVFTGGIGENSHEVRVATLGVLEQLGFFLEGKKDRKEGEDVQQISVEGKGVRCFVVQTNEELEIATQVRQVVNSQSSK